MRRDAGLNRIHAVLGGSEHCIATHPSDMAVGMLALGAEVEIEGADGAPDGPARRLPRPPGDTPQVETVLEAGDLITAVTLPAPVAGRSRPIARRATGPPTPSLSSRSRRSRRWRGRIDHVALAFGGLAPKPWRDAAVEDVLRGQAPDEALFDRAADILLADASGHGDNDFKIPLARRLLKAVLRDAEETDHGPYRSDPASDPYDTGHVKMDAPTTRRRLDEMVQGVVSTPLNRPEGPLKVTGTALYAAEAEAADLATGVLVRATIAEGTLVGRRGRARRRCPACSACSTAAGC